jgi:membrane protease YdiL (CAAX protease family)
MPLLGLSALGPLLAAVLWSSRRLGGPGHRALWARLRVPGVPVWWYLAAPLVPGMLLVGGLALYGAFWGVDAGPWLYLPRGPERLMAMVVFSVGEEVGWRGFAHPRLRERYGALSGSLLLGLLWGLWHVPMFLLANLEPGMVALLVVVFLPAGSVVFGWFFERTRGSLVIAILLHMGAHLNNSHLALPQDPLPTLVHTAAYVLLAGLLVAVDRKTWRRDP